MYFLFGKWALRQSVSNELTKWHRANRKMKNESRKTHQSIQIEEHGIISLEF